MSTAIYVFAGIALGLVLGCLIGWLLGSRRRPIAPADSRLEEELRQQNAQRDSDLSKLRGQLTDATNARAAAEAKQSSAENLLSEQRALHEKALQEAKELQAKALADLRDTF